MNIYEWQRPFAVHLKRAQHCQSAILQYKIKSLKIIVKYGSKILKCFVSHLKNDLIHNFLPLNRMEISLSVQFLKNLKI